MNESEAADNSNLPEPVKLSAREVFQAPGVKSFIIASSALYVGLMLQAATLGKHIYDITGREIDIGWLGLAEFFPVVLLVFVTGTVADRYNRRRVAVTAMVGELMCALALVFYARTNPTSVAPMFMIAVAFGASRAFVSPAMRSIGPMIAPEHGLPQMVAMYSAVWTGAMIIGPAMSGFLYAAAPWIAYATSAGLTAMGIILISRIKLKIISAAVVKTERPTLHSAMEGLRFIRRTPILLAAISLDLFAVLFGGAIALLPVIAKDQLMVGDVAYGWLRASVGIGAASTAAFLAFRPIRRHVGRSMLIAVGVFGLGTVVLGLTSNYWVAFFAVMILSAGDMISVFVRGAIVPLVTPDDKRGRVSAVENVFIGATNELGAFESGVVSQLVGVKSTVVGGGVATLGIVGIFWYKFKQLRNIDTFDELSTEETTTK
ncbi:MAG: MFS transporter [Actinobacteria bacterium]|nr:MFS transporter [Actinomycetota bacterium]MDA3016587.1 MFS transporter [Actinomycetota bacterium]